jgi:periodic tryptophan protein 2
LVNGLPVDDHFDSGDETGGNNSFLPGAKRGDDGTRSSKVEVIVRQLAFSSTGREWGAISGEGLHIYAIDDEMTFDPIQLTEALTPAAVIAKAISGEYSVALRMAININEGSLIKQVVETTPFDSISRTVQAVAPQHLERLIQFLAQEMATSPHIEFYLTWCMELLRNHGLSLERSRSILMKSFRALYRTVFTKFEELKSVTDNNKYVLEFLENQGLMQLEDKDLKT